jgi:hypothetical protein
MRAGRPEPSHQVVALDHQILDHQVHVGHCRQPAYESPPTGLRADCVAELGDPVGTTPPRRVRAPGGRHPHRSGRCGFRDRLEERLRHDARASGRGRPRSANRARLGHGELDAACL